MAHQDQTYSALRLAVEQAQQQRDDCTVALRGKREQLSHAQQQLDQLQLYAHEMDAKWLGKSGTHVSSDWVRHQSQFLGRLTQAMAMQEGVLQQIRRQESVALQALGRAEQRLLALQKLLAQRQLEQLRRHERKEQQAMDELSLQLVMRNPFRPGVRP